MSVVLGREADLALVAEGECKPCTIFVENASYSPKYAVIVAVARLQVTP